MKTQPIPIFIVGSGRSGTTITASLLNRLPGVHIARETGYLSENLDLLRDIGNADSLHRLVKVVNSWLCTERWEARASIEGFMRFCEQQDLRGPGAFVHYVWQLESRVAWDNLEYIGDNTPLYAMSIPALLELMPDARFIHVVRDPRDVVCSMIRMKFGAEDPVAAALEWHVTIGCWMMAERIVDPAHRIECRYENLCLSPKESFGRLAEFLGRPLAESAAALASHQCETSVENVTPNNKVATFSHHVRLNEPLSPGRIGRYKSELSPEQLNRIEEILQYGMRAYGYQPERWHTSPLLKGNSLYLMRAMIRDAFRRFVKRFRRKKD